MPRVCDRSSGGPKSPSIGGGGPTRLPAAFAPGSSLGARRIRRDLLTWYARTKRPLPWRDTRDPYLIWVSEVMCQQTQVATVIDYYERWRRLFPDCESLARAELDDVLRAWEGLGYYSRAKNLKRGAAEVVARFGGRLPRQVSELRSLPGVGEYSAGAIASIAFGEAAPAIDGNAIRVLTRLFRLEGDPARAETKKRIREVALALLPSTRPGDFNQALMELGATHCSPRSPSCETCPVRSHCESRRSGCQTDYPQKPSRPKSVLETRAVGVVVRRGRVLGVRVASDAARWASMWQFPDVLIDPGGSSPSSDQLSRAIRSETGVSVSASEPLFQLRHQVTRHRITLEVFACRAGAGRPRSDRYSELRWCDRHDLAELPMPAAHREVALRWAER